MATSQRTFPNLYRDSVTLMQLSSTLRGLHGIRQASAVMATENNISLLVEAGLLAGAVAPAPNNLLIVIEGEDDAAVSTALDQAKTLLENGTIGKPVFATIEMRGIPHWTRRRASSFEG